MRADTEERKKQTHLKQRLWIKKDGPQTGGLFPPAPAPTGFFAHYIIWLQTMVHLCHQHVSNVQLLFTNVAKQRCKVRGGKNGKPECFFSTCYCSFGYFRSAMNDAGSQSSFKDID